MKLTEIKTQIYHCFRDEDGKMHGLYQSRRDNGENWAQIQYNHGMCHGEYKFFQEDGTLHRHVWHEHDKLILNFSKGDKYPTTPEERLIFKLTYQGEFIPN